MLYVQESALDNQTLNMKTARLEIRLTPKEKQIIVKKAKESKMSISRYVTDVATGAYFLVEEVSK